MPRIPVIQTQSLVQRGNTDISAGPSSLSAIGQAVAGVAGSIYAKQERARAISEHKEEQARAKREHDEANLHAANTHSRLQIRVIERQTEAEATPDGLVGYTDRALKAFDTDVEEEVKGAPEHAKPLLRQSAARMREDLHIRTFGAELAARRTKLVTDFGVGLDADRRLVQAEAAKPDYSLSQFNDVLARRRGVLAELDIPQQAKQKLDEQASESLAYDAAVSIAERDPAGWLRDATSPEAAKSHPIVSRLSPDRIAAIHKHAKSLVEQGNQQDRYQLQSEIRDVQTMVLSGIAPPPSAIPTEERFVNAYGPTGAQRWREEVGSYIELGGVLSKMQTASFEERRKMIEQAQPTAGQGFAVGLRNAEAVTKAAALLEKRIAVDPAAYALQTSTRVQNAAAIMDRVLNDPKMPAEDRVAAMNFYAETQVAWQRRAGVQEINDQLRGDEKKAAPVRLLTNTQANQIAARFYDQAEGGAKAADLVASLEQQWGKHWPSVYAQLASDNKLPPAALVIPNMPNDASRSRMATASAMKTDDLKALVDSSDPKAIRDAMQSQFDAAQRTFTAQGADGSRTLALVMGEAEKLALSYRAEGKSVSQAAKQAYTETMGWRYEFGETYRIPREQQPTDVKSGAVFAQRKLAEATDLQVFSTTTPQSLTADAIRARGFWVTTGDESGLRFVIQGADGGMYAVRDKAGKPIGYDWETLRRMATEAKTPDAQRDEHLEEMRRRQQELNPRR